HVLGNDEIFPGAEAIVRSRLSAGRAAQREHQTEAAEIRMKRWNAGKLIASALLMGALFARIPSAHAAPPLVMGYYTNWATYGANYQPGNIVSSVDRILYAFTEVGDCGLAIPPTEVNYTQPGSCQKQVNQKNKVIHTGTQDFLLHSTDQWSDF